MEVACTLVTGEAIIGEQAVYNENSSAIGATLITLLMIKV